MCGIGGIWGKSDAQAVSAMVAAMRHRGPDDSGIYRDAQVALGMTRLSIIDVSAEGHQPMQSPDGQICIVYNGEVYNFQSERRLLEEHGYHFTSASDTEVVLRMYEHYGDDFLLRLQGMFALAIYDKRRGRGRERLFLARDPFGIKPLLYTHINGRFIFASELKALLASNLVEREIEPEALRLLLTYGSVAQPLTMLRGVRMLMPAHRLILEGGQEKIQRYWSLDIDRLPDLRTKPYEELVEQLASVLEESVRLHLVSDVPVGAFLSGGIDSSLLVALMTRLAGQRVKTFSVGFETEGQELDESDIAGQTAAFLGSDHTNVLVRGTDVRDHLSRIAYGLDQPSMDGVNTYFVSMAARRAVKVAISGLGSDELFAGYYWFDRVQSEQLANGRAPWKSLAKTALANFAGQPFFDQLSLTRQGQTLWRARNSAGFLNTYDRFASPGFGALNTARLLHPQLRKQAQAGRAPRYDLKRFDELPGGTPLERVTGVCLRGYMTNQLLRDVDAVSMSHSLEVRVPFLDRLIADMALSLPDETKLNLRANRAAPARASYRETGVKRILVDAGRPLLPRGFDEQPKRGFLMPFDAWLRGPLKDILHETLDERQIRRRGWLDAREVSQVKENFFARPAGRGVGWAKPWLLLMLEVWCREVLEHHYKAESRI